MKWTALRPARTLTPANDPAASRGNGAPVLMMVRRFIVFLLGMSVLLVGVVMLVAPGPAIIVIPLGLGILATEFVWARTILNRLKQRLLKNGPPAAGPPPPPD